MVESTVTQTARRCWTDSHASRSHMDGSIPVQVLSGFVTKTKKGNTKGAVIEIDEPE